jgi:hypothetical protein
MRAFAVAATVVALALAAPAASAWAPETRMAIADEAMRLMPKSLRLALDMHRVEVMTGLLEPLTEEDAPAHRAPWSGGQLDATLAVEARRLVEELGVQTPFRSLATRFGRVAHFAMDAGFPPGVGDDGGGERYAHFSRFCESRRPKFPLVFYGHDDPALERRDWRAFALSVMERSRGDDRLLARAYAAAGRPPAASAFDDRSIPFAVGSLSFSRSVNDVVRIWLAAWDEAGGDMGRTPFRDAASVGAKESR